MADQKEGGNKDKTNDGDKIETLEEREKRLSQNEEEAITLLPVTTGLIKYQVILMIVSCHYAMVLTNWGHPSFFYGEEADMFAENELSYGIKLAMWIISFVVYAISQLLGCCCPANFEDEE